MHVCLLGGDHVTTEPLHRFLLHGPRPCLMEGPANKQISMSVPVEQATLTTYISRLWMKTCFSEVFLRHDCGFVSLSLLHRTTINMWGNMWPDLKKQQNVTGVSLRENHSWSLLHNLNINAMYLHRTWYFQAKISLTVKTKLLIDITYFQCLVHFSLVARLLRESSTEMDVLAMSTTIRTQWLPSTLTGANTHRKAVSFTCIQNKIINLTNLRI